MAVKLGELLTWIGRLIVSILVAVVIAQGLKLNSRFSRDPLSGWLAGIFAGVICLAMLSVIAKKS